MDKRILIRDIMIECKKNGEPVSYEEAVEMSEMEMKARENCKRYEREVKPDGTRSTREKKIDLRKVAIIDSIALNLDRCTFDTKEDEDEVENIKIVNEQKEITFTVGEDKYSITLTKHRKGK